MKHTRLLFGFMTVLGIVFLAMVFTIITDSAIYNYVWELFSPMQHLLTCLGWIWLLGGTFFLTTGIAGIGRQYLRNSQNPFALDSFTMLAAVSIPSVVFGLFLYFWMGALEVGF